MKATGMLRTWMTGMAAAVCATALAAEPTDADVKAQYVKAGRCYHAEDMDNNYAWAFRMAGSDTNRYARILRELAEEATNQTRNVMIDLRFYRTPESLPFLYAYSTNALYGADALKSIFAIEGVTSNSVAAAQGYLSLTNSLPNNLSHDRSEMCKELLNKVFSSSELEPFRGGCLNMMVDFAKYRNTGHVSIDNSIQAVDPSYRFSKRRLSVMRSAQSRCVNDYQVTYVTNAINELVAYPEANLPD